MIICLNDVNGRNVEIRDEDLAYALNVLSMDYSDYSEVQGFIDWLRYGCQDKDEEDDWQ